MVMSLNLILHPLPGLVDLFNKNQHFSTLHVLTVHLCGH
jgi:hypothetical protein